MKYSEFNLGKEAKDGIKLMAIVSRDGMLINSYLNTNGSVHLDTFAAMCATLVGAAETISIELKRKEPEVITVESKDVLILVKPLGSDMLLVCVSDKTIEFKELGEYIKGIKERLESE